MFYDIYVRENDGTCLQGSLYSTGIVRPLFMIDACIFDSHAYMIFDNSQLLAKDRLLFVREHKFRKRPKVAT